MRVRPPYIPVKVSKSMQCRFPTGDDKTVLKERFTSYHRAPFFKGYKLCIWAVHGNYFHESTLVSSLQPTICVMIEFLLILGETNFMEVPKIHKICSFQKRYSTVSLFNLALLSSKVLILFLTVKAPDWLKLYQSY